VISGTTGASVTHFVLVFWSTTCTVCLTIKIPDFAVVIGLHDYPVVVNDGVLGAFWYRASDLKTIYELTLMRKQSRFFLGLMGNGFENEISPHKARWSNEIRDCQGNCCLCAQFYLL
jgi:hypothetical protein